MKSVFQKGFMYRLSCQPSVILYIAENKTLAGKEKRSYEEEAMGRKLAIVLFEDGPGGLVRRVDRGTAGMQQVLLTLAEMLQTIGGVAVPPDPERPAAQTELLLESYYQTLELQRYICTVEPAALDVHMYTLEHQVHAETAYCMDLDADHRTKMVLARALERNEDFNEGETLQGVWGSNLAELRGRSAHLFPAPVAPVVPPAPVAPPGPPVPVAPAGRGRGRGRGRGGPAAPPAGRGRGRGALAPAAPPAGRGRGRGRGRGP